MSREYGCRFVSKGYGCSLVGLCVKGVWLQVYMSRVCGCRFMCQGGAVVGLCVNGVQL